MRHAGPLLLLCGSGTQPGGTSVCSRRHRLTLACTRPLLTSPADPANQKTMVKTQQDSKDAWSYDWHTFAVDWEAGKISGERRPLVTCLDAAAACRRTDLAEQQHSHSTSPPWRRLPLPPASLHRRAHHQDVSAAGEGP